jgi:hypothetical protein
MIGRKERKVGARFIAPSDRTINRKKRKERKSFGTKSDCRGNPLWLPFRNLRAWSPERSRMVTFVVKNIFTVNPEEAIQWELS